MLPAARFTHKSSPAVTSPHVQWLTISDLLQGTVGQHSTPCRQALISRSSMQPTPQPWDFALPDTLQGNVFCAPTFSRPAQEPVLPHPQQ